MRCPGKWILGLDGNDTITGTVFADPIIGAEGTTITWRPGNDFLEAMPATTRSPVALAMTPLSGAAVTTLLSGGVGNDSIARPTDGVADTVNGDAGNDTCNGDTAEGDTLTGCEM